MDIKIRLKHQTEKNSILCQWFVATASSLWASFALFRLVNHRKMNLFNLNVVFGEEFNAKSISNQKIIIQTYLTHQTIIKLCDFSHFYASI
eukprot:UN04029